MQKNIIDLKNKNIKKRKEKQKEKKKENSREVQKPNVETEVYNNNKNVTIYTNTYTLIS